MAAAKAMRLREEGGPGMAWCEINEAWFEKGHCKCNSCVYDEPEEWDVDAEPKPSQSEIQRLREGGGLGRMWCYSHDAWLIRGVCDCDDCRELEERAEENDELEEIWWGSEPKTLSEDEQRKVDERYERRRREEYERRNPWVTWLPPTHENYFDPERPNITASVRDALKKMACEDIPVPKNEHGIPKLSVEALAFLWHRPPSGMRHKWSDAGDWSEALNIMVEAGTVYAPYLGHNVVPLVTDHRNQRLIYGRDWPTVLAILQRTGIRELMKYAAICCWILRNGGMEVPPELRAPYARLIFPRYRGQALTLYRGCVEGYERHMSWTASAKVARDLRSAPKNLSGNR